MADDDILNTIERVAKEVFRNSEITLSASSTAESIEEWDSLNHIQFILSIEKAFSLKFKNSQVARLECIGDLVVLIKGKLNE